MVRNPNPARVLSLGENTRLSEELALCQALALCALSPSNWLLPASSVTLAPFRAGAQAEVSSVFATDRRAAQAMVEAVYVDETATSAPSLIIWWIFGPEGNMLAT